jgi:diguanylate cyclase (GGDEF)-like protein
MLIDQPHRALGLLVMAWVLFRFAHAYGCMRELSLRDPLTGLLNRRGFEELAGRELERVARYGRPVAFAVLDVDHFKQINDRFGHAHGDRVLQCVAAELAKLRTCDLAVRLGGDEFGLLMPETDEASAARVIARLKRCVHERTLSQGHSISLSAGIAAARGEERPLEALLEEADGRMYRNKPQHGGHSELALGP